ncbi:DUF4426 domain-containing protein [Gallaecimonas sp. GXIMD4217]|uniref:DUF4426 domain-containing protein n=1 Tax=Gallaecimonas sp. GXIMD4217 TaxID=3131927 RepID=UPI00311B1FF1
MGAFTRRLLMTLAVAFAFVGGLNAEQMISSGHYQVHYQALATTFLPPEVAANYGIKRSRYTGLLNVSVLDQAQDGKPATAATLKGVARNLLGHRIELDFKEIREGQAIYYIAEVPHSNEETYRFDIQIATQDSTINLKFEHKFYVD